MSEPPRAALEGFGNRKVVIILGGDGKGQDFTPLMKPVQEHCRAVVLIGRDAPQIKEVLAEVDIPKILAKDMKEAVTACRQNAREGDVIFCCRAGLRQLGHVQRLRRSFATIY